MHRTQIYLDSHIYKMLEKESEISNLSISEIIRRSIRQRKNRKTTDMIKKMEGVFGIWKNQKPSPEKYVRGLRKNRTI